MTSQDESNVVTLSIVELAYLLSEGRAPEMALSALAITEAIQSPSYLEAGRELLEQRTRSLSDPQERKLLEQVCADVAAAVREVSAVQKISIYTNGNDATRTIAMHSKNSKVQLTLAVGGWFFVSFVEIEELRTDLMDEILVAPGGALLEHESTTGAGGWAWDGKSTVAMHHRDTGWKSAQVNADEVPSLLLDYLGSAL